MTHSYLAVGISGAFELIPLIIFGLYGGVVCTIAVIGMAIFLPKFRRYDVETDIHALQEREKRKFKK